MYASRSLPPLGSLLRWGGLLTLALALVGGLLGMHVIGNALATPMTQDHGSHAGLTTTLAGAASYAAAPVSAHAVSAVASSPASAITGHAQGSTMANPQGSTGVCGCSSSGCDTSMTNHGSCIPVAGSAIPAAPLPGLVPDPAAGSIPAAAAKRTAADLLSNTPSLIQLSVNRT